MTVAYKVQEGDVFHAPRPEEYLNPKLVDYFAGRGLKKELAPISYSICVMYVSKSYVFYNSVSMWSNGLTRCAVMQRMERCHLELDMRTGNLGITSSRRQGNEEE